MELFAFFKFSTFLPILFLFGIFLLGKNIRRQKTSGNVNKQNGGDLSHGHQFSHTILLVQPNQRPETRTYSDYESVNECLEGICKIFEEHLKRLHPHDPSITYDISQLFEFIDQLTDLSCVVFQKSDGTYIPHNKDWLKEKIYQMLLKQAGK